MGRAVPLEQVNDRIREMAADLDPYGQSEWGFVCECGSEGCDERIALPLVLYDDLKKDGVPLIAQGHPLVRGRRARAQARELRDEALALRNEARHQRARWRAFEPLDEVRMELCCSSCGYGVCVKTPPARCPMCLGSHWLPRMRRHEPF